MSAPTRFGGFCGLLMFERLHPVGRPFGFRWVQNWRGARYVVLNVHGGIVNPITARTYPIRPRLALMPLPRA